MAATPSKRVVDTFLGGHTRHTRRVEVYEADGVTLWRPDVPIELIEGSVSVNYGDGERRTLDLTLGNADGHLRPQPGGLWYDKIIKVFRGVDLKNRPQSPRVAVVAPDNDPPIGLRKALSSVGFKDTTVFRISEAVPSVLAGYSVVILYGAIPSVGSLATTLYQMKIPTFVIAAIPAAEASQWSSIYAGYTGIGAIPFIPTTFISPTQVNHPVARGWAAFQPTGWQGSDYASQTLTVPTLGISNVSYLSLVGANVLAAAAKDEPSLGRKFVGYHVAERDFTDLNLRRFLLSAVKWLDPTDYADYWEIQCGEFMVDRIRKKRQPSQISITGRDYVKKCQGSKFVAATQFATGLSLESVLASIAGSAGITRRMLPNTGVTVGKKFLFDRGVTRWEAMQEIVGAYDYELYFDHQGTLTLEKIPDPALNVPDFTLKTGGDDGSLVEYEMSAADTRIYNVVVVTGESSDTTVPPVYAVARNENPNSPTSVAKIGERVYQYVSSFITTTQQAQDVANSFLNVHALEEFEVSFESLMLPWFDVGSVVRFEDPDPVAYEPDVYLLTSLTIPLGLAPMSASAKRVMKVV